LDIELKNEERKIKKKKKLGTDQKRIVLKYIPGKGEEPL